MDVRRIAMITGWLWIITFVTSIPARFIFYAPVLEEGKDYVLGQGDDAMTLIAVGALLELILIFANIGTAVVPYSIHKRVSEPGALGFVTARVMESVFIAVGSCACWPSRRSGRTRRAALMRPSARVSKRSTSGRSVSDLASSSASATA
jgi:hypothetical protein